MNKIDNFLDECASWINYKEYPPYSNNTVFGEWYGLNYEPWCDMFISYCAAQCNLTPIIGKFAGCVAHAEWFYEMGRLTIKDCFVLSDFERGDIVFFKNKPNGIPSHVGVIESIDEKDFSIVTIEGNTSISSNDNGGSVMRRYRPIEGTETLYIHSVAKPDYERNIDMLTSDDIRAIQNNTPPYIWGYETRLGSSVLNEISNIMERVNSNGRKLDMILDMLTNSND